jgi:succinate-semialdehyde dehydrogenase/glutarate-semialdehyde dehydrogenase
MGKPLRESLAEIDKCALLCDYYIEHAEIFLASREEDFPDKHIRHTLMPTGVVFGIMPWNYPFWQVFRYAIPNLVAGNVVLLKHAPNTTGCAVAMQALFEMPNYPTNLFQSLIIDIDLVERVIAHPAVQGVCLTGSVSAGRSVGALAGKHLKKVVLELGSADAFVILNDASIDKALDANFQSRMQNAGQACIAAKRTFVPRHQFDYAIHYLQEKLSKIQLGDPLNDSTHVGPISKKNFVSTLQNQVNKAVNLGGTRIVGAEAQDVFFKPGLIVTKSDNAIHEEEIFGPVINLIAYDSEQQLIEEVNGTAFGLAASVWSSDEEHALNIANQIEAGTVVINDFMKSDPRIPFGGIKNSGFGRELGEAGLRSFLNEKPIVTVKK